LTRLHIDFESRSTLDLRKVGLDRYARNATVLMMAYAFDDEEPKLWLPTRMLADGSYTTGLVLPTALFDGLRDPEVVKVAWNKRFEQMVFRYALPSIGVRGPWLDPAVLARSGTLPGSLDGCSKYLNLGHLAKHAKEGKRLINKFSKPFKGKFREPADHPEDFKLFGEYCKQDVRAEREVLHRIEKLFPLTPFERRVEQIDAEINQRGMPVDMQFVREAKTLVEVEKLRLQDRMRELTGLANPNSNAQLLAWLQKHEYPFSSLGKAKVEEALRNDIWMVWQNTREALELRQKLSRSSTSKLDALLDRTGPDDVLRHSYKYLGAERTGRWSGEGVQLQNLPR
jgi:DNA polymerase bacteriophage-type